MAGGRRWGGGGGGGAGAALAAAAFAALALAGTCAADGAGWAGAGGGAVPLQRPPDMVGTAGSGRGAADRDEHAVFVSVADAPTSRVVVYTDRAEVTRAVTSVRVPAGRTRVTLWNVSALLVHESARVDGSALSSSSGGHGAPSVAVLEVSESRRMGVPAGAAPPLRQALERAQAALATAEAAVADAAERLKRAHRRSEMADTAVESALSLQTLGSTALPLTRLTSELASINELIDWADAQFDATMVAVGERRASLELAMRTRDARKGDVDAALAALDEPAAQSAQPGVKPLRRSKGPASSISAMVETSGPATLSLEFTYMVSGAQWAPTYDVRSSADPLAGGAGQAITVGYVASVTQSTGEDWASGELTLSTARPNVGASPPHLRRSTVGLHSVRAFEAYGGAGDSFAAQAEPMQRTSRARMVKRGSAELAMAAMDNSADGAGYEDAEEDEAVLFAEAVSFTSAVVAESGTSTEYVVADAAAVPCDGQPHRITIATMELASRMSYIAAPRAAAKVRAPYLAAPMPCGGPRGHLPCRLLSRRELLTRVHATPLSLLLVPNRLHPGLPHCQHHQRLGVRHATWYRPCLPGKPLCRLDASAPHARWRQAHCAFRHGRQRDRHGGAGQGDRRLQGLPHQRTDDLQAAPRDERDQQQEGGRGSAR